MAAELGWLAPEVPKACLQLVIDVAQHSTSKSTAPHRSPPAPPTFWLHLFCLIVHRNAHAAPSEVVVMDMGAFCSPPPGMPHADDEPLPQLPYHWQQQQQQLFFPPGSGRPANVPGRHGDGTTRATPGLLTQLTHCGGGSSGACDSQRSSVVLASEDSGGLVPGLVAHSKAAGGDPQPALPGSAVAPRGSSSPWRSFSARQSSSSTSDATATGHAGRRRHSSSSPTPAATGGSDWSVVRVFQVLPVVLAGRAHTWHGRLNVHPGWTCWDSGYFEAPGASVPSS